MTPEERQALREKHQPSARDLKFDFRDKYCRGCTEQIDGYEFDGIFWPCDVIKVLDATELDVSIIGKIKSAQGGWLSSDSIDLHWDITDEEANYLGASE